MSEPFVSLGLPGIAFERWGAAPEVVRPPAIQPMSGTTIVISNVDAAPSEFRPDTTYQNLIQLAREYSPTEITEYRRRARFGDPRWLYAFYDEALRVGINVQHSKMLVRMRSARVTFETYPNDLDGEAYDEPDETPEQEAAEPDVNEVIRGGVDRWPHGIKKTDEEKEVAEGARDARDYVEEQLTPWIHQLLEAAAEAHSYGLAGAWIRVKPGASEDGLDQIEAVSYVEPRRFRVDQFRNKLQLQLDPKSSKFVDADDYVAAGSLIIFDLAPTKPLDQKGLFWQSIVPWAMFQYGFRWWAKFLELFGIPFRSATYDANTAKARSEVEAVLAKAGTSGWAALPAGTEITMSSPVGGGAPHQSWAEFLIRTFDQIWLGHGQASGVQADAGSQTSTDAAFSGADELIDARLAQAAFWINEQVVRPLVKRNKGDLLARFHCPRLSFKVRSAEDVSVLANIANIAVQAGAGDRIDADDFVTRLGFKLARRGKPTLSAPPAAAQPGAEQPGAESGAEKAEPPVAGEPPEKKKGLFSIVPRREPDELIRRLDRAAVAAAKGAGDPIVARYADVLVEAKRDGADIAQTLTRVKRAAQHQGVGQAEVAEHLAVVAAAAFFEGFESVVPDAVVGFAIPESEQFMADGQKRVQKGSPQGGEWTKGGGGQDRSVAMVSGGSRPRDISSGSKEARAKKHLVKNAKGWKVEGHKSGAGKKNHNGGSLPEQRHGEALEPHVTKALGGILGDDNGAFDVTLGVARAGHKPSKPTVSGRHGVEVKAMTCNITGKITMTHGAPERKRAWQAKEKAWVHTVIIDDRAMVPLGMKGEALEKRLAQIEKLPLFGTKGRDVYYYPGVGSPRIGQFTKVTDKVHLAELIARVAPIVPMIRNKAWWAAEKLRIAKRQAYADAHKEKE